MPLTASGSTAGSSARKKPLSPAPAGRAYVTDTPATGGMTTSGTYAGGGKAASQAATEAKAATSATPPERTAAQGSLFKNVIEDDSTKSVFRYQNDAGITVTLRGEAANRAHQIHMENLGGQAGGNGDAVGGNGATGGTGGMGGMCGMGGTGDVAARYEAGAPAAGGTGTGTGAGAGVGAGTGTGIASAAPARSVSGFTLGRARAGAGPGLGRPQGTGARPAGAGGPVTQTTNTVASLTPQQLSTQLQLDPARATELRNALQGANLQDRNAVTQLAGQYGVDANALLQLLGLVA